LVCEVGPRSMIAMAGRVVPNSRATARMVAAGTSVMLSAHSGVRSFSSSFHQSTRPCVHSPTKPDPSVRLCRDLAGLGVSDGFGDHRGLDRLAGDETVAAIGKVADEFAVPQPFGEDHMRNRQRHRAVGCGLDIDRPVGGGHGGVHAHVDRGDARLRTFRPHLAPHLHQVVVGAEGLEKARAEIQDVVGVGVIVGIV
jgi:hypothetical protein